MNLTQHLPYNILPIQQPKFYEIKFKSFTIFGVAIDSPPQSPHSKEF